MTPILFRQRSFGGQISNLSPIEGSNQDQPEPVLYVVAGERRCEAAKKAGLTEVPAILVGGKYGEIALVENLLRQDLTPEEKPVQLHIFHQENRELYRLFRATGHELKVE